MKYKEFAKKVINNYAKIDRKKARFLMNKFLEEEDPKKIRKQAKKQNKVAYTFYSFLETKTLKNGSKIFYSYGIVLKKKKGAYKKQGLKKYGLTAFRYPGDPYVYIFAENSKSLQRYWQEVLKREGEAHIVDLLKDGLEVYPWRLIRTIEKHIRLRPARLFVLGWQLKEFDLVKEKKLSVIYKSEIAKLRWKVFSRTRKADWHGLFEDTEKALLSYAKSVVKDKSVFTKMIASKKWLTIEEILNSKKTV